MAGKLNADELAHIKVCREELYPDPELDGSRLAAIKDVGRLLEHIEAVEAELVAVSEMFDAQMPEGHRGAPGESPLLAWQGYKFFKARRMLNEVLNTNGDQ